jgi:hypothetical protein
VSNVSLGVTWNITDNITLDAMTGVVRATGVDVFGTITDAAPNTDNLTYFGSILASLKF